MKSVSKRFAALILSLLLLLSALIPAAAGSAPQTDEPVALNEGKKQSLLSALYEADIASISEALDRGFITSYELTAYYLERIETYNEPYNCFITVCDNALTEAAERDLARKEGRAAGPLFGIDRKSVV